MRYVVRIEVWLLFLRIDIQAPIHIRDVVSYQAKESSNRRLKKQKT